MIRSLERGRIGSLGKLRCGAGIVVIILARSFLSKGSHIDLLVCQAEDIDRGGAEQRPVHGSQEAAPKNMTKSTEDFAGHLSEDANCQRGKADHVVEETE